MTVDPRPRWRPLAWVLGASLVLHLLIAAIFLLPTAFKQQEPAPQQSVNVELVPPPEEKAPEQKKAEDKSLAFPKLAEAKPEEKKPPELPKPEKAPEQKKADTTPPPKPAAPPKPPEAPKQPEQKPPQAQRPEQPTPEPAKPDAEKARLEPLKPVFKFGDKDSGPKTSDGDSAENAPKPDEAGPDEQKPDETKLDDAKPEEAKPAAPSPPDKVAPQDPAEAEKALATGKPAGAGPLPPKIDLPQINADDSHAEKDGPAGLAKEEDKASAPAGLSPAQAEALADAVADLSRPPVHAKPASTSKTLTKAKTLFSSSQNGGDSAMTAMSGIPRGTRIGQLCATELSAQLRHAAFTPEILPAYRLPAGTSLNVPKSQFRSSGQWYDLSFQCDVDADATKVVSFAFKVGAPIPRSQWQARHLPDY